MIQFTAAHEPTARRRQVVPADCCAWWWQQAKQSTGPAEASKIWGCQYYKTLIRSSTLWKLHFIYSGKFWGVVVPLFCQPCTVLCDWNETLLHKYMRLTKRLVIFTFTVDEKVSKRTWVHCHFPLLHHLCRFRSELQRKHLVFPKTTIMLFFSLEKNDLNNHSIKANHFFFA